MANEDNIEMFKKAYEQDDEIAGAHFPLYFVSQPPHRDGLEPVYYKMVTPHGPIFWRTEGDDAGRETSFFDFHREAQGGFGIKQLDKEYTPWSGD